MSDNLVLEMLRAMRADMGELGAELREQRGRLGAIERLLAHLEREGAEQRAEMGGRFDRIHDRLDRIDRRLEPKDA